MPLPDSSIALLRSCHFRERKTVRERESDGNGRNLGIVQIYTKLFFVFFFLFFFLLSGVQSTRHLDRTQPTRIVEIEFVFVGELLIYFFLYKIVSNNYKL